MPAVKNAMPKSVYNIPLPPAWTPPITEPIVAPSRTHKVAYGRLSRRPARPLPLECHTPMGPDGRFLFDTMLGAGGLKFDGPWGTTFEEHHLRSEDRARPVERPGDRAGDPQGRRPAWPGNYAADGLCLLAKISAEDMGALIAFLRTVHPKKTS